VCPGQDGDLHRFNYALQAIQNFVQEDSSMAIAPDAVKARLVFLLSPLTCCFVLSGHGMAVSAPAR